MALGGGSRGVRGWLAVFVGLVVVLVVMADMGDGFSGEGAVAAEAVVGVCRSGGSVLVLAVEGVACAV